LSNVQVMIVSIYTVLFVFHYNLKCVDNIGYHGD